MSFEEFCCEILENVVNYLPDYNIETAKIEKVTKNNGVECTGIVIVLEGENVAPNIYLDYYFMIYKQGRSLDDILRMISEEYERARDTMSRSNFNVDIDGLRDNAVIKLVNYERNKEKLKDCPHIKYFDLAITFRFLVKMDECGVASALISNSDIKKWNVSKEELYQIAKENTRRLFPETIRAIDEILPDMEEICPDLDDRNKLYVLSNESGVNGATCVLYDDVIKNFANSMGCSLFIMPSSIHEMILICCEEVEKERLKKLVKEVNKFIVSEIDYLSDSVYFYDLETDKITI
ncbi:MAG: hypothetical protein IKJ73_06135 [Lachnospiraceae bacterium]|nr:hypothetical protein [Lachnospiraceae bacterium]